MADAISYKSLHRPAGGLFTQVRSAAEAAAFRLDEAQVAHFHEHGYLAPVQALDGAQLEALREGMTAMTSPGFARVGELQGFNKDAAYGGTPQMIYFQGSWHVHEAFHDSIFNARVTVPAAQLLGTPRVRFWHDQVFFKPARHGGVVAWHQDYSYWQRTEPVGHLTCFIALDDATLENGCLHVVPGSHRWKLLPTVPLIGGDNEMEAIQKVLSDEQKAAFKPVPVALKAGQCSFHHPFTVHGSYSNTSERPRRSLVLNFMKPETRSKSEHPLMPGAPAIPPGAVIEGDDFPVVVDTGSA